MPEEVKINTSPAMTPVAPSQAAPSAHEVHVSPATLPVTPPVAPTPESAAETVAKPVAVKVAEPTEHEATPSTNLATPFPDPVHDPVPKPAPPPVGSTNAGTSNPVSEPELQAEPIHHDESPSVPEPIHHDEVELHHDATPSDSAGAALHEEYGAHVPNLLEDEADDSAFIAQTKAKKPRPMGLIITVTLVALALVGVGAMSYLGYRDHQQAQDDKAALQAQVSSLQRQLAEAKKINADAQAASATSVTGATAAGSLKMPELGVIMPLPSGLSDLNYAKLPASAANPTAVVVGFSTTSLLAACGSVSQCDAAQSPLGTVTKTAQAKRPAAGYGSGKLLATLGGFDYVYNVPAHPLLKPAAAVQLQTSQENLLQAAIPQVTLIK